MSDSAPGTARRHRLGFTLALLAFAQLIVSVDYNIVYVALPEIGSGLGFSAPTRQWVVSAYAVVFGGFLLLGGRASDLLGRRRMFVFGLFLYAVSSLAGGLATSAGLLVAARAVQGLGGAFLFPATLSLVSTTFAEGRERNRALSVWAAMGAGGMVLGSLLGGVLTQAFGWAAVFFVNVPLAGVAMLLAAWLIVPDGARGTGRRFDLPGALTATAGATLVVLTLVQGPEYGWTSPGVIGCAVAGAAMIAAFMALEWRNRDPLVPLRLFGNRNLSTGITVAFLFMATFGTLLYVLTIHFQTVRGYSAFETGIAFLAPMGAGFLGSMLGGGLATRFGVRATLVTALTVGAAGAVGLGLALLPDSAYPVLLPGLMVLSVCQGVVFTCMFAAATTGVTAAEQGVAGGMVSTGAQIGSAVGLAAVVAIANAAGLRTSVFLVAAGIAATVGFALVFKRAADRPLRLIAAEPTAIPDGRAA